MTAEQRLEAEKRLVEIVLNDLAKVHNMEYETLRKLLIEHHAYDWYSNEFAVGESPPRTPSPKVSPSSHWSLKGAFAFFGPGQFGPMYTEVTQPAADFLLHFAGEGTSTNHA